MNKIILMGRLTADTELRYIPGENPLAVAHYCVAVNRKYQKNTEQNADFINCTVFGKSAEFANEYFKKGMRICVSGRLKTGKYTDKDGNTRYTTEVIVEDQEFAQSKKENSTASEEPEFNYDELNDGDDLPF